jgi:rhomboid protease GluP
MWTRSGLDLSALWAFDAETLIRFGAKMNVLIQTRHEWWRFVTPVFIHGGILHLLFNMYGLWILGPYVERLYGSAKFVVIWVVTGVAGVVASYFAVQPGLSHGFLGGFLFRSTDEPSVGASGALFGLVGVLFVFGIKYRHELPDEFKRAFGAGMLPTILLNLFIGFSVRFIDNAAHLGGLLSGMALAAIIDYKRSDERDTTSYFWHAMQIICVSLVVVSFGFAYAHHQQPLDESLFRTPATARNAEVVAYSKALNDGEKTFVTAMRDGDTSEVDSASKELQDAPALDPTAGALRDELRDLLIRARELQSPRARNSGNSTGDAKQLVDDYKRWIDKRNEWLNANSEKYGLRLSSSDDKK